MKYNESFYVVNHTSEKYQNANDIAVKVKGATYQKDKRLFIHRGNNCYILTDKQTGLYVVVAKTLKKLDEKFNEKIGLYNKVFNGKLYNQFKSNLKKILYEGVIAYEK